MSAYFSEDLQARATLDHRLWIEGMVKSHPDRWDSSSELLRAAIEVFRRDCTRRGLFIYDDGVLNRGVYDERIN